ncbi:hypothetical protein CRX72_20770 [Pantoea sp. BRM17]|nr:hypothetical protein CRX72_20770 [Pantoea sp. BRM17]
MELFDLRQHERSRVLQAVLDKGTSRHQLTYDDRALRFLRTFVEAREKENYFEIPPANSRVLEDIVARANTKNALSDITGILLFDGRHFFQLLEGPDRTVRHIYDRIRQDARHHNLVELMHDFAQFTR